MIDALANKLADAFIKALRPRMEALIDEQIARIKAATGVDDVIKARDTIRRHIGL